MRRFAPRTGADGQGLVEFALVLPVFMVILIGMVDLGRAIWANNSVANSAREAARFASVHGGSCEDLLGSVCSSTNYCPVGPKAPGSAAMVISTMREMIWSGSLARTAPNRLSLKLGSA